MGTFRGGHTNEIVQYRVVRVVGGSRTLPFNSIIIAAAAAASSTAAVCVCSERSLILPVAVESVLTHLAIYRGGPCKRTAAVQV